MLSADNLIAVAVAVVFGLIIHIVAIFALPALMDETAQQRAERAGALNAMSVLPAQDSVFFEADPVFEVALCPFDLREGPLHVTVPLTRHYTSLSFFTPDGTAFGGLNDRAAVRKLIDAYVATPEQKRDMQGFDDSDKIVVVAPQPRGFALVRAMKAFPSEAEDLRIKLAQARCTIIPPTTP